jgi:diaminopimelate epimerase
VEFEKWQALGNDYLVLEEARLPFALTPARVRRLCAAHTGVGADGILLLAAPGAPGCVARLRVLNPDGSEAEVSGNGARQAVLYLHRRGWTAARRFCVQSSAGELRAEILGATRARVDHGRARLRSAAFPGGPNDGRGELEAAGRRWRFRHVSPGNPQCTIRVADPPALAALDLGALGPALERHPRFPQRTNVSFWAPLGPGRIRARVFERGAGETLASGTGAMGAAVASVLDGGDSPVTVALDGGELEVAVGDELRVALTGEAAPVYAGTLSAELLAELGR